MLENVIQIKSEITRHVRVSMKIRKKNVYVKKIIFEILLNVDVKMVNI